MYTLNLPNTHLFCQYGNNIGCDLKEINFGQRVRDYKHILTLENVSRTLISVLFGTLIWWDVNGSESSKFSKNTLNKGKRIQ